MAPAFEEWAADERAAGMLETLVTLVRDKLLDLEVAAKRANMPVSEFQKLL